jgi:hypothetical protein
MRFRFRESPKWFYDHVLNYYTDELHAIQKAALTIPDYDDQRFKQIAVDFFIHKGFTVWLDEENHLWFDVDSNSAKWTFEILRT